MVEGDHIELFGGDNPPLMTLSNGLAAHLAQINPHRQPDCTRIETGSLQPRRSTAVPLPLLRQPVCRHQLGIQHNQMRLTEASSRQRSERFELAQPMDRAWLRMNAMAIFAVAVRQKVEKSGFDETGGQNIEEEPADEPGRYRKLSQHTIWHLQ